MSYFIRIELSEFPMKNELKCATLMTYNERTKNHNDTQAKAKESTRGFGYELPGDLLCPVSSQEKFISHLPPDVPASYLHPRRKAVCAVGDVW